MDDSDPGGVRNPTSHIQNSYDSVAREYADEIYAELADKPFDRELLDRFAKRVGSGRVCDLGCGPGQIARYLWERGVNLFGLFHLGTEDAHHDELFGRPVSLDVAYFTALEMSWYLQAAGFRVEEALERDPYAPEIEYQSRRGYILASRPLK